MVVIVGALLIMAAFMVFVVGLLVLMGVMLTRDPKRPKPKRPDPPIPPGLREFYEEPKPPVRPRPAPKPAVMTTTAPSYIRRWGPSRKSAVAADKAQWEKDFSRLLPPPSATAPERDREFTRPSAPPPAPTPDEVFTGLRKRLSNLA